MLESIQALYDGGFRGAELCMQTDSAANNQIYAYGSAEWSHKWKLMMNKLLDLGMGVYLTSGTNWSTSNVPGLDPDSQAAMHVAAMSGTPATVEPGALIDGALPAPATRRAAADFIGAYAFRQTSSNVADFGSCVDLSEFVAQPGEDAYTQNITWTAPTDGTYRVYGLWSQGNYHSSNPAAQTSYCTNYFDLRGIAALREFWEANYLNEPALNQKIMDGDVQLFMDSIEINVSGGVTWWSEDMAEVFEVRKGYDIRPYLFLMAGYSGASFWQNTYTSTPGTYRLAGDNEVLRESIIFDYHDVISQLLSERMLVPLKEWLNSMGIKTRAQVSYGKPLEMSEPIMALDYPETENRVMMNQVDYFRNWTGGAKLENKVLSTESSAQSNTGYRFSRQMHLRDAYAHYAAGVQRVVWHIWNATYGYGEANAWPGHNGGGSGFFKFGQREPNSRDYDEFNAHLGRVQQLMQTGKSRTDVGFVSNKWYLYLSDSGEGTATPSTPANINRMNWQLAHQGIFYRSTELQDNGYTYDYFSPKFLYDDDVYFDEETKTIEQAGYKALVLYQEWLDASGAERILEWARKGLPVVILGGAASRTPFNDGKDTHLAQVVAELESLPSVRRASVAGYEDYFSAAAVGYEDDVMEKLQELGVYPYSEYAEPNHQLLTQTRVDGSGNMYLYAYNYCPDTYHRHSHIESVRGESHGTNIKTEIAMEGTFIPYSIDAWTGKVTQLACYRYENGRTVLPIDLDYDNIALFAFEAVGEAGAGGAAGEPGAPGTPGTPGNERLHIVKTDVESSYAIPSGLVLRTTESGTYSTALSDGKTYRHAFEVPVPYDIADWDMTIESWSAGTDILRREEPQILDPTAMTVNSVTATEKTNINVRLPRLATWDDIPEVGRGVSGLGRYEASFDWDAGKADGAYIDFGDKLVDSMKVWINGQKVGGGVSTNPTKARRSVGVAIDGVVPAGNDLYSGGVSLTKPIADVSEYLVDGENKIVIEYSSSLTNVQLARGAISAAAAIYNWFGYVADYRSYGPSQAVVIPFAEKNIVTEVGVAAEPRTLFGDKAEYTFAAGQMDGVNLVEITFEVDGGVLGGGVLGGAGEALEGLNGFSVFEDVEWTELGGGKRQGKAIVGLIENGATASGSMDVAKLRLDAVGLGDAKLTLTAARAYGIDIVGGVAHSNERATFISPSSATTKVYSIYDIDADNVVGLGDLSLAFYYYMARAGDADWDDASVADVNGDGVVNMLDLVEIYANFIP